MRPTLKHNWHLLLLLVNLHIGYTAAQSLPITLDDTDPNITYTPHESWNYGPNCTRCLAHPDPTRLYNNTWHDVSCGLPVSGGTNETVSISFNGSAVWVYCALDNVFTTALSFFIDEQPMADFSIQNGTLDAPYVYNQTVYSNKTLKPGVHTLTILNGQLIDGTFAPSLLLLDSIQYQYVPTLLDPAPSTTIASSLIDAMTSSLTAQSSSLTAQPTQTTRSQLSSKDKTIVITVACVGAAVIVGCVVWAIVLWRRRTKLHGTRQVIHTSNGLDGRRMSIEENSPLMITAPPMAPPRTEPGAP